MPASVVDSDAKTANSGAVTSKSFTAQANDLIVIGAFGGYTMAAAMALGDGTVADGGGSYGTDQVGDTGSAPPKNCALKIGQRFLTAAGSYTFTAQSSNEVVAFFLLIRGALTSGALDGYNISATGQGTGLQAVTSASLTPSAGVTDDLLINFAGLVQFVGATTWTPPSGMTEVADASSPNGWVSAEVATQALASSAATGTKTATSTRASGDTINGVAQSAILIRSAPAVTATGRMLLAAP